MDFLTIGIIGVLTLMALLALGVNIGANFIIVGLVGVAAIIGVDASLSLLGDTAYYVVAGPTYCMIPLFVLMGAFAARGGFAQKAYKNVHILAARIPSSLAIATSIGSAAFATICGSSLATASIFGKVAYPEMAKHNYDKSFALGSIASSGTFACMIPPSGMMILFAIFTEQSVGKLFMAGVVPGVLTAFIYSLSMYFRAKRNPKLAPMVPAELEVTVGDRSKALIRLWPIVLLATVVVGGMYAGYFTPTEAAAVGAASTLIFGLQDGKLRKIKAIKGALRETAHTTAMLLIIIITAMFFSRFLAITQIPSELASFFASWDVHRSVVLIFILVLWMAMGMFMIQAAVFALTLPILFPVVVALGYNPLWFCIVAMKLNEIAGVTPPVGLNAFALAGADETIKIGDVYKGVWPFLLCDVAVLILLFIFPEIVTFLPDSMGS